MKSSINNKVAIYNVLKGLLVAGGPLTVILIQVFGVDSHTVALIVQAGGSILSVVGMVWLGVSGTDANVTTAASEVKGVQVHVDTLTAPPSVVDVAKDEDVHDVVPMIGGPRRDTNKETADPPPPNEPPPPSEGGYRTLRG